MRHRRGKFDVTHAFAAHDRARNFDATLFAHDAAEPYAAIFAAVAFVVFFRTKNALIKEAVFLRSLRSVVDGFRLSDFTIRPIENSLRRGEAHYDRFEVLWDHIFFLLHIFQ